MEAGCEAAAHSGFFTISVAPFMAPFPSSGGAWHLRLLAPASMEKGGWVTWPLLAS
jgi:hypothetical protein